MTVWIDTSDRDSARILRFVAGERAATSMEAAKALDLDPRRAASIMRNFANRGRLKAAGCLPVNGCPTVYVLTDEAVAGLDESPFQRRPRRLKGPPRPYRPRASRVAPLPPRVARWCRSFLSAGWSPREIAELFDLEPADLRPLRDHA